MRLTALVALATTLLTAAPAPAVADESLEEPGRLAAVQRRKYRLDHEIFAAASLMPLDAFYKAAAPAGSYTLHFSDTWGWEVVRGAYAFDWSTGLREQLEKDFQTAPTKFGQIEWLVSTAAVFKPLYGKFAMLNASVAHAELYGLAGATAARFSDGSRAGPQLGLGLRFFLSPAVSLRVESRYHALLASGKLVNLLEVASGLAFNLGGGE